MENQTMFIQLFLMLNASKQLFKSFEMATVIGGFVRDHFLRKGAQCSFHPDIDFWYFKLPND